MTQRPAEAAPGRETTDPLARAIAEFNSWRFYDCHETLEDVWREAGGKGQDGGPADFYQGIIKLAAGFHHLLRGNHKGAVSLLSDALRLLEPFRPTYLGVDVQRLLDDVRPCLERIVELGPRRLRQFDRSLIPTIQPVQAAPTAPSAQAEGLVEANGIRLHYLTWQTAHGGHASLPPVVLLHATGFLARLWQPIAERLASRFHVYAYDTRGHGDSDKPVLSGVEGPETDYHWQRFVDDLRAFLETFALRGVPIVGHSSGGAAAVYLAATEPQYASRLVLIEPIIMPGQYVPDDDRRPEMASGARRRRMVWGSREELVQAYRSRPTFARWREDVLRLYAKHGTFPREDGQVELKCPGEVEAQVFENSASLNIWDVLPRVDCPTLVMKGERTEGFLSMVATGAAGRMPNARLVTVPNAGHLAPMERPEAVATEIMGFLAGD